MVQMLDRRNVSHVLFSFPNFLDFLQCRETFSSRGIRFDRFKLIKGDKDDATKSRVGFSSLSKTGKKNVSYD